MKKDIVFMVSMLVVIAIACLMGGCYSRYQALHLGYGEKARITAVGPMSLSINGEAYEIEVIEDRR
jgi:hypothetical protein